MTTFYELTAHELERARQCAQAYIDHMPEWQRDIAVAEAQRHGIPSGLAVDITDPDDVRVAWAGRVIVVVPRAALAGDEPLAAIGELPTAPDTLPDAWTP